jgi:hypothetical protein
MTISRQSSLAPRRCTASGRNAGPVDVVAALEQLHACALERPAGSGSTSTTPLVASALARTGLPPDALATARLFTGSPRDTSEDDSALGGMTLGALVALRAAERAERTGADAEAVVSRARAAVMRYVSVLPASLFG